MLRCSSGDQISTWELEARLSFQCVYFGMLFRMELIWGGGAFLDFGRSGLLTFYNDLTYFLNQRFSALATC